MSYGTNICGCISSGRHLTGRILKGAKPAPAGGAVDQVRTGHQRRTLDLTVPPSPLARADEVIE
jgi:hypothetical protein